MVQGRQRQQKSVRLLPLQLPGARRPPSRKTPLLTLYLDPPNSAAAQEKAAEAARKKAEKDALLKEEEAALPSKAKSAPKAAQKKTRGLDLSSLDADDGASADPRAKPQTLNASNIDDALDALSITAGGNNDNVDRHPERRFKAAYAVFEERRLEEMRDEKGLRRNQKVEQIRKEFEKHPENPFNQVAGRFNSTREELREMAKGERDKTETRLGSGQGQGS